MITSMQEVLFLKILKSTHIWNMRHLISSTAKVKVPKATDYSPKYLKPDVVDT